MMEDLPQAHMSTGFPYGSFLSTSGLRYPGVPAKPNQTEKKTKKNAIIIADVEARNQLNEFAFRQIFR